MYQVDHQSRRPIYEQIIDQIETYVLTGILKPQEQLLSVRALSLQMHLNPNTVQRAYTELDKRKVIYTVSGKGTFVTPQAVSEIQAARKGNLNKLRVAINEMKISGIKQDEIIEIVNEVYKSKEVHP